MSIAEFINLPWRNKSGFRTGRGNVLFDKDDLLRDGFSQPVRVFSKNECAAIMRHYRLPTSPQPAEFNKGYAFSDPFFYKLATRPAIIATLNTLLGEDIVLWGASILEREPGQVHMWHADRESWSEDRRFVSVWIGLENTNRNSALSLVSRSHLVGKPFEQVQKEHDREPGEADDQMSLGWAREYEPDAELIYPEVTDGEALFFDGSLWHGSHNRGDGGRRTALLLQYTRADTPVHFHDFSRLDWPFPPKGDRSPVVVVRGTGDESINRILPPPQ